MLTKQLEIVTARQVRSRTMNQFATEKPDMVVQSLDLSTPQNYTRGKVASIPLESENILDHAFWQNFFISGLGSVRLLQEEEGGFHNRMLIRIGSGQEAPPPTPTFTCGLCGSRSVVECVSLSEIGIGVCDRCHSGIVLRVEDKLESDGDSDDYSSRYTEELMEGKIEACWKLLWERTDGLHGANSLLDVGCGSGKFLDIAKKHGVTTAGVEISPLADLAAVQNGHEIYCKSVEVETFPPGCQFDIVVMWDILEHLSRPRLALRSIVKLLAPGGRLFIVTPMMGSIFDRWCIKINRLSGTRLNQLIHMSWSRDHLFRFQPDGISRVLDSLGYSKINVEPVQLLSLQPDRYAGGVF
jgi:SAM-dependent methyltransferase